MPADSRSNGGEKNEKFTLDHKPPPNYRSVLNLRNREQAERDKKAPKKKTPDHIAVCGANCAECEYYAGSLGDGGLQGCPGCNIGGNDCDIRICCLVKSCKSCYYCEDFPCDKLKASDAESDDSDLVSFRSEIDRKNDRAARKRNRIICGCLLGLVLGLLADMIAGSIIVWTLAGIVVGTAIPLIAHSGD